MCTFVTHRDLAVGLMVFAMRLELARARALEGLRVGDEEGPTAEHVHRRTLELYDPKEDTFKLLRSAGECSFA
jgi:hypothetical protein